MDVLIISRPLVVLFRYMIPPEVREADEVDYKVSTFHVPACPPPTPYFNRGRTNMWLERPIRVTRRS